MAFIHAGDGERAGMVEVIGRVVMQTAQAVLFDGDGKRHWLPKRFVIIEDAPGGGHVVVMRRWLAKEKGYV